MNPFNRSNYFLWLKSISRFALFLLIAGAPIFFFPITRLPVHASKEIFVFSLILIALLGFLGIVFLRRKIRYPISPLILSLGILVFVWFLSSLFSVSPWNSFIGSWSSPHSFAAILLFSILTVLMVLIFDRSYAIKSIFLFLGGAAALGILNILQFSRVFILPWSFTRVLSWNPVGTTNDLAILMGLGFVLSIGILMRGVPPRFLRALLVLATLVFSLNLILINFLSAWVGIILAMVLLAFFSIIRFSEDASGGMRGDVSIKKKIWLPLCIVFAVIFLVFNPITLSFFHPAPDEVSLSNELSWKIGTDVLQSSKFLLGSGPNTFNYLYHLEKPQNINDTIFWNTEFNQGASVLSTWLGTVGALGMLAILFLIIAFFSLGLHLIFFSRKFKKNVNAILEVSSVGTVFMMAMWFAYAGNFTNLLFTFWCMGLFLLGASFSGEEAGAIRWREIDFSGSSKKRLFSSLLIIFLILAAGFMMVAEWRRYAGESYFSKAFDFGLNRENALSIDYLTRAINLWQYDERYWQSLAQAIFLELNSLPQNQSANGDALKSQFQNIINGATGAAKRAAELNPANPFNAVLLGDIYSGLIPFGVGGVGDLAIASYSKAISLYPQNPSYYVSMAKVYVTEADVFKNSGSTQDEENALDNALTQLEKALAIKKDFIPAAFSSVQIFDREGKVDEAIKISLRVSKLDPRNLDNNLELGYLYYKNNQLDEAESMLEMVVAISPNNSNARYFLGLTYDRKKMESKTIEQFQKIAEIDQQNTEVKNILINLKYGLPALYEIIPVAKN